MSRREPSRVRTQRVAIVAPAARLKQAPATDAHPVGTAPELAAKGGDAHGLA